MSNMTHESFWDCIEQETTVRKAHRRVGAHGDQDSFLVSIYACSECEQMHVLEEFDNGGEWEGRMNHYALTDDATVDDVLAEYGL